MILVGISTASECMNTSLWSLCRGAFAAILVFATAAEAGEDQGQVCFTAADNQRLGSLQVISHFRPPRSVSEADYRGWPATAIASQNIESFATSTWPGTKYAFIWANRSLGGFQEKANPPWPRLRINGRECRPVYTSIAKANAATRIRIRYLLDMDYSSIARDAGFTAGNIMPWSEISAQSSKLCAQAPGNYLTTTDIVWLPPVRLPKTNPKQFGVMLDYEVHDDRTPAQAEEIISDVADDVHAAGHPFALYTNPLNGPSMQHSGLTPRNMARILQHVDLMNILIWGHNIEGDPRKSYEDQLNVIRGPQHANPVPANKLMLMFEVGGKDNVRLTVQDARNMRQLIDRDHISTVYLWRHRTRAGGPCNSPENQAISALLFRK
jgi:hypothetical protein